MALPAAPPLAEPGAAIARFIREDMCTGRAEGTPPPPPYTPPLTPLPPREAAASGSATTAPPSLSTCKCTDVAERTGATAGLAGPGSAVPPADTAAAIGSCAAVAGMPLTDRRGCGGCGCGGVPSSQLSCRALSEPPPPSPPPDGRGVRSTSDVRELGAAIFTPTPSRYSMPPVSAAAAPAAPAATPAAAADTPGLASEGSAVPGGDCDGERPNMLVRNAPPPAPAQLTRPRRPPTPETGVKAPPPGAGPSCGTAAGSP